MRSTNIINAFNDSDEFDVVVNVIQVTIRNHFGNWHVGEGLFCNFMLP